MSHVKSAVARHVDALPVDAYDSVTAVICADHTDPVMGTPGIAFWGGYTLGIAMYDLGRHAGG